MPEWTISIRPVVGIEPDPHGYLVANFHAHLRGRSASGVVGRGRRGLHLVRLELESGDWGGMDAQAVRDFPAEGVLAAASVVLGMPLVEVPEGPCPCGHH